MKLISIKRKTSQERRRSVKMGELSTKVTYIKMCLLGIPLKTLFKYRETYYGEIKDCDECRLSA